MHVLQTDRLTLRPFDEGDLDRIAQLFANPGFMRFSGSAAYTLDQTVSFLQKVMSRDVAGLPSQFAVVHRDDGLLIGYCGFFAQELDGEQLIEIGYRLDPAYWNRGIGTEAARAVRDHALGILRLDHVVSFIHPENHASRRVAEKNGMTLEKESVFRGFPTVVFGIRRKTDS